MLRKVLYMALCCLTASLAQAQDRVMVFGDSNSFGWTEDANGKVSRFAPDIPWPSVMAKNLGKDVTVITEALGGRTTEVDRPLGSGSGQIRGVSMNGAGYLPAALSSHMPLELVVIMLGTNDMNDALKRSAQEIAQSLGRLTDIVRKAEWQDQTAFPAPKVLIVSPPKMNLTTSPFAARFTGAKAKSEVLAGLVKPVVTAKGAYFFDAATVVEYAEQADQIHLTAEQHRKLGEAVAEEVKKILGSD